ncbi:MAG: MBL fold metallo-hydrolase [Verrucomicrobiae bacterium]|nr:MBL fold metallo-hydrolase [Verrucomicrobiae bacterium]
MKESLEDHWHDILSKAARGLQLDAATLTQKSHGNEKKTRELFEGMCHPATLATVAPALHLDGNALLAIAADHYHPGPIIMPRNFKRFTSSYHGMQVNSYLLWSEENKKAVAFDTGADMTPLLKTLEQHQLKLDLILLTHGHSDHVCQLENLIATTGAPAWINEADLISHAQPFSFPRARPLLKLADASKVPGDSGAQTRSVQNVLEDASTGATQQFAAAVEFGKRSNWTLDNTITIEARPTPGHSPGGTTYVVRGMSSEIAVVGDALFAGSVGGIPPSSYEAALKAIRKNILSLPDDTILSPGHGPLTTVGDEKARNPFFARAK